jgi:hypothetical protein
MKCDKNEFMDWDKKDLARFTWALERQMAAYEKLMEIKKIDIRPVIPAVWKYDFSMN